MRVAPEPPAIRAAEVAAATRRGRWRVFQRAVVAKSDAVVVLWDRRRRAGLVAGHLAEVAELLGAEYPVGTSAVLHVAAESVRAHPVGVLAVLDVAAGSTRARPVGASAVLDVVAESAMAARPVGVSSAALGVVAESAMAARPVGASAALGVVADSAMAVGVSSAALDVVVAEVTEVEPDVAAAEVVAAPDVAAAKVAVVPAAAAVSSPSLRRFAAPALPRGSPAPRGLIQTLHSTKSFLPGCAFLRSTSKNSGVWIGATDRAIGRDESGVIETRAFAPHAIKAQRLRPKKEVCGKVVSPADGMGRCRIAPTEIRHFRFGSSKNEGYCENANN